MGKKCHRNFAVEIIQLTIGKILKEDISNENKTQKMMISVIGEKIGLVVTWKKNSSDSGTIINSDIAIYKKWIVRFVILVVVIFVIYPVFSQKYTQNTYPAQNRIIADLQSSLWEQPVRESFQFVPDPYSYTTLRILPGRENAGYWANVSDGGKNVETIVLFFRNVSSTLDNNYLGNAAMLSILDRTLSDKSVLDKIDYITVTGASSPDGSTANNERLAAERALAIKNYIVCNHLRVNRDRIITFSAREDWDGLRRLIADDYKTPSREEALRILSLPLSGDDRRNRLQQLASGSTYKYLAANMFPALRGGAACMIYFKRDDVLTTDAATDYKVTPERKAEFLPEYKEMPERKTTFVPEYYDIPDRKTSTTWKYDDEYITTSGMESEKSQTPIYERSQTTTYERWNLQTPASNVRDRQLDTREYRYTNTLTRNQYVKTPVKQQMTSLYDDEQQYKRTALAVKTNLLFDVVTALNVEVEAPIGDSWSIAGEYIFPWWLNEQKQNCSQLIGFNLELRHWFGYRDEQTRLTGWFGGLFAGGGYFDFERDKKGYQGEFLNIGLSAGYAHEISRDGKWRMEYSFGLGYLNAKYREYNARYGMDNEWHLIRQRSGNYSFVGPLRAKISLVWTLKR